MNELDQNIKLLNGARNQRALADVLVRAPDVALLKFSYLYHARCERLSFAGGYSFLEAHRAVMEAKRNDAGAAPQYLATELGEWRFALSQFAAGAGGND